MALECFGQVHPGGAWNPHLSLSYDEPKDTRLDWACILDAVARRPSLVEQQRHPTHVSLWSTEGTMAEWQRLESYPLPPASAAKMFSGSPDDVMEMTDVLSPVTPCR